MKGKLSRMLRSGLSMMLVFCMLISMAPAVFATEDEGIKYDVIIEDLADVLETYGPEAEALVWAQWEKFNYEGKVEEATKLMNAALEALYADYTNNILPVLEASLADLEGEKNVLVAELEVLKNELEAKKAALEEVLAEQEIGSVHTPDINIDAIGGNEQTIVPDNECVTDGTSAGELKAAIADLEHAIAVLEALISDINADIADMIVLVEQIVAAIAELEMTINDMVAAGEDLVAAVEAVGAVLADSEGVVDASYEAYEAARALAEAALAELEENQDLLNAKVAEIEKLVGMAAAGAYAVNVLVAEQVAVAMSYVTEENLALIATVLNDNYGINEANVKAELEAGIEALKAEAAPKLAALEAELEALIPELEAKQAELEEAIKAGVEEAVKAALEDEIAALQAQIDRVNGDIAAINEDLACAIGHLEEAAKLAIEELKAAAVAELKEQLAKLQDAILAALKGDLEALKAMAMDAVNEAIEAIIAAVTPLVIEATTEDYVITKDSYYVALGDGSAVSASYVDRVAAELGVPFANLSVDGQTMANAPAHIAANAAEIAKADLITLGYGNNAFAKKAVDRAYAAMAGKTYETYDWTAALGADGAAYVADTLADIKADLLASGLEKTLADATVLALEAYAYYAGEYVVNLPAAIAAIREINPDAVVLIVGMYNPLEDATLVNGDASIDVGAYLDALVQAADVYGIAYCILFTNADFVSIPDAQTNAAAKEHDLLVFLTEYLISGDDVMNPNAEGHEYIKTKILGALNITVEPGTFYKKFMEGFDATTFRPNNNITRAQAAKMFCNILDDSYKANYKFAGKFTDIPEDFWAAKELEILSDMGVILGFEDGTFRPNAPITRGQFAAMAVRFVDATIEGTENFSDIDKNTWCYDYVRTAVANGWIDGYSDGTYRPQGKITRAAAAKIACGMLDRPMDEAFFDAQVEAGAMKALDDTVGTWAYYWILSATNSFVY